MNKYLVTEEQIKRIGKLNALLAREIMFGTTARIISDSVDALTHFQNLADELINAHEQTFELLVTGGKFVWVPEYGKTNKDTEKKK